MLARLILRYRAKQLVKYKQRYWDILGKVYWCMYYLVRRSRYNLVAGVGSWVSMYHYRGAYIIIIIIIIYAGLVHSYSNINPYYCFFQGMTIKPIVEKLRVKKAESEKPSMNQQIFERVSVIHRCDMIIGKRVTCQKW